MKKTFFTLLSLFTLHTSFSQTNCVVDDLSSNAEWTQIGTSLSITDGKIKYDNTECGPDRRVLRTVPTFHLWKLDFSFKPINFNPTGPSHVLMAYTAGQRQTEYSPAQQARVIYLSNPTSSAAKLYMDAQGTQGTQGILAPIGSTYYIRMERTCATQLVLSVFSDAARTKHVQGSPIISTLTENLEGLNTLQSSNSVLGPGNPFSAELDNITLCGSPVNCHEKSSFNWTQIGSSVTATNDVINFNSTNDDGIDRRVIATVPKFDLWKMTFRFQPTDYNSLGPAHILLSYSNGTLHSETASGLVQARVIYLSNPTASTPQLFFDALDSPTTTTGILAPKGSTYYVKLERRCATELTLSVFSDPEMTIHVAGSPLNKIISESVNGFNTLQSGNSLIVNNPKYLTAQLDNIKLCGTSVQSEVITSLEESTSEQETQIQYSKLSVYDFSGKELMEAQLVNSDWKAHLTNFSPGIYIARLSDGHQHKSFKIGITE